MGEFFGSIYCIFEDFFGLELAEYLWGTASPLSSKNSYIGIGLWMLGISFGICLLYYILIDHPKLSKWWGWLIFFGINTIINFLVGWQLVLQDYYDGKMVTIDPATNLQVSLNIGTSEILCFGVSNMLLSMVVCFIFSLILKFFSRNCRTSPF